MGVLWTSEIPTIVFARVTEEFSQGLKTKYGFAATKIKYPWMDEAEYVWNKFSTSQISETPPEFPYITIIELPGVEQGQDLEGKEINAATFTFQVDVFDNQSETRVKNCMAEIVRIMKSMSFSITSMPSFESRPQEYRQTARFSRIIGFNDPL